MRRVSLVAIALATLLASLGTSSANVALPRIATAFAAPFAAVQWVVLAYLLTSTASMVVVGRLGDHFGLRRLLLAGISLFTLASLAAGFAPTLPMLILARATQGIGAAAMTVLAMAYVGSVARGSRSGRMMGLLGTTSAVGTALGPSLGGALLLHGDWPALFAVNVPLGLLTLWLAHRHLPSAPAGIAACVHDERRTAAPLLPRSLLAAPATRRGLAGTVLVTMVLMATLVVGPFHLARGFGLDAADVGLVMATGPLVAALVGIPAGRLVDRIGAGRMARLGFGGITVGAALLALLPTDWGLVAYVVPLLVLTAHYAAFQTANNSSLLANVPADRRGALSGLLQLARNLGSITGSAGMGAVFAVACGDHEPATAPADVVADATRFTFAMATLLLLGAGLGARCFGRSERAPAMPSTQAL